jgi:hypothetical protein
VAGLSALQKALEAEGIEFVEGNVPGVLLHPKKGKVKHQRGASSESTAGAFSQPDGRLDRLSQ